MIVATTQMLVAWNSDLTPWRGGGFGMFSTLDNHDLRQVRIELIAADGDRVTVDAVAVTGSGPPLSDHLVVARAHPSPRSLEALGRALAAEPSLLAAAVVPSTSDEDRRSQGTKEVTESLDVIHLEVWRVRFDRFTNTLDPEVLVSHEVRP